MYFLYWPVFLKLIGRMFTLRYFRLRFVLFVGCIILPAILMLRIIVSCFQFLDYIFFPGFRNQEIKQPLFILSNPRSGSTFLHRMLEKDEQYTYLTLWQSLLNSVTLYKLVDLISRAERLFGCPIAKTLKAIDKLSFKGWDGKHKAGLNYSEEDEFLFVNLFLSPGLILFFPYLHEFSEIYTIDELPGRVRKKVASNIRRAIQRHVYASGGKTFLAKNATAGGRLGIYLEAFPDMRAIYIHSDIVRSVSSSLSVFTRPWSLHSPACYRRKYESLSVVEMVRSNHQGIMRHRHKFPYRNVYDVQYGDLVTDPEAVVNTIYYHFDMSLSPNYSVQLKNDCEAAKTYKSTHFYNIEDYGFTHEEIAQYMANPIVRERPVIQGAFTQKVIIE